MSLSGVLVFSPNKADCFGEFDPATSTFECHDVTSELSMDNKFYGGVAAPDGRILMPPGNADCVGIVA